MEQAFIRIEHLCKHYHADDHRFTALDDVNLTIDQGDVLGIIGQSGAGKSTLIHCLNLLEKPTSGKIIIDNEDVTQFSGKRLREFRPYSGMIFQNFALFQQRTILSNVMFPLELTKTPKTQAQKRAEELLEWVGLADKAKNYPSQLSGGQQQRVAIARALANSPKIMLCDEATSALDTITTHSILNLLKKINTELEVTMILITHSFPVAMQICNKVAVLDKGKIVETGCVSDVLTAPKSKAAKTLLAAAGQMKG